MSDSNVIKLAQPGALTDPLTEILRSGARALLTQAVEAEVAEFLAKHTDLKTETGQQRIRDHFVGAVQGINGTAEIDGIPERDGGGDESEPARTVLLGLDRAIAQAAEAVEADSADQGVARFALVQLRRGLAPQARQLDPVQYEQRALDPSDFAQGQRQSVLAGVGAEALEEERGAGRSGAHRGREAQGIVPMGRNQLFIGAPADERLEHRPCAGRSQGVEASLGQVGNARGKIEANEIGQGEVVIADAAAIGVMGEVASGRLPGRARTAR